MELERKYTALQPVNNEFNLMKSQLVSVQNKTSQISNDVLILKQLGSIKPLQIIQSLQTAVQTVSALTHSLSVNERTRSQDVLALYNMTIDSNRELGELTWNTSNHFKNSETKTSNQLSKLEHRPNKTATDISNQLKELETKTNTQLLKIEKSQNSTAADIITRVEAKETSDNLTMTMVQKQINNNAERGISNQYVTASEFINETVARHQENKQLRQFVNKALAVLTSQLQQNFDSLEQKLQKCENQSSSSQDSLEQKFNDPEHKYMELERKNTQLQ
ncbi:Hypothetical predicted protein [Mytilus galloprovincialis]|uniref:Uncharacterized protein n=1 Tax=Mytilus galloprovincialis TaxID=29158 RepID=A0A8B6C1J5_MYTGA|nr:Hypothetical predicted protein [Mytilus galloprovincialis]